MNLWVCLLLAVMGAVMGSFACCQAWRLHEKGKKMPKRSVCMRCGHRLKWYENVPIISWLVLRGKCKKCGEKIGAAEILMEVFMALAFLGCYLGVVGEGADGWTYVRLVLLLILLVILGVLMVYDGKWGKLPTGLLFAAVLVAGFAMVCREVAVINAGVDMRWEVVSIVVAVGLLSGLYLVLSKVGDGGLVGDGDWLLGLALGLALADWWLALITLAGANMLAVLYAVVARKRKIYFAPFYVLSFAIVLSLGRVLCLQCLI